MDWKYVVFRKNYPILLPPSLTHSDLKALEQNLGPITSAGFVQIESGGIFCYGKSESLGVESGPRDAKIIESHHLFRED
jgi:hypothetical protein